MIYDCNMTNLVNSQKHTVTVCLPSITALNSVKGFVTAQEEKRIYENMTNGKVGVFHTSNFYNEEQIKSVTVADRYSENQPCVHLIGHLDENGNGVMGLEKAYDSFLNLQAGKVSALWSTDALGNVLYGDGIEIRNENYLSPAGIQLTIDLNVQRIAENALENHNITKGAVVILNGETNEILASASVPHFDPVNLSVNVNDNNLPFINRAITPYSVGSVFKPLVAASAIEKNVDLTYECVGKININGTTFKCSNEKAHGTVNMNSAMMESCNTYFIALGQKLGCEPLISLCSNFGLGKETELADNFYLKSGNLPASEKINSPQALANLSFGQGELLASPLQLAVAYSVFANGGFYRAPTIMKAIIDENGIAVQKAELPQPYRIINENTVKKIDEILKDVVTKGNGIKAYSEETENHGKTATAQSGWYSQGKEINHTWFCGYFTVNNKKYVTVIFKEDGLSGAEDCAPVFKEISEKIAEVF